MTEAYDAIVIGGGLGGLTAGALWAKEGKRVLLVERHDKVGGAATVYKRNRLELEVGLHEMDGFAAGDFKWRLWNKLDLEERVERVSVPEFFAVRDDKGDHFVMPHGRIEAEQAAIARFPDMKRQIRRYFATLDKLGAAMRGLFSDDVSKLNKLVRAPVLIGRLIRSNKATVGNFLDELFGDREDVKKALAGNIGYFTHDPSKLSLIYFAIVQSSFHGGGGHYFKGGSQSLSDSLAAIIEEAGGKVLVRRSVKRILVENGNIRGVEHVRMLPIAKRRPHSKPDPQTACAPIIFGNAAPHVLAKMLPEDLGVSLLEPGEKREISTSLWTIFVGLDEEPEKLGFPAYSTIVGPSRPSRFQDIFRDQNTFSEMPNADNMPGMIFVDYSRLNCGMNTNGRHFMAICGVDHTRHWNSLSENEYYDLKGAWEEALLERTNDLYPGFKDHVLFSEMGTARTTQDYLNTPGGAVYGYNRNAPYLTGPPTSRSPVKGLFISSAFGAFGGGFTGAMLSGEKAAAEALNYAAR